MPRRAVLLTSALCCAALTAAAQQPPAQAPTTNLGPDANGNPRRLAVKTGRVPVIRLVNVGGGRGSAPAAGLPAGEPPVAEEILARGWGYATVAYQDIQPDRATSLNEGVIALARPEGQPPAPGDWGAIGAWAWGVSRAIDYLETDRSVDPKRIALEGHSRLGKTALWASALDTRVAAGVSSCAGEMGSALSRRDWGETVDDMAQNFPWWFSETYQKWVGRWGDMPVDAHMLIALSAP